MRFHKTLTFLILATGLAFALPAWAQQKPFTQEQVASHGARRIRRRVGRQADRAARD